MDRRDIESRLLAWLEKARQDPHYFESGPQTVTVIERAERRLGLSFPYAFRQLQLLAGSVSVRGVEVYGVVTDSDDSGIPDVVWVTRELRSDLDLPPAFVAIAFDGSELYELIEAGSADVDDPPVLAWAPGFGVETTEVIAAGFLEYLDAILARPRFSL